MCVSHCGSCAARRASRFIVVLTLALGVGVATTVFCVFDAVILRPLPFANPERIVAFDSTSQSTSWPI